MLQGPVSLCHRFWQLPYLETRYLNVAEILHVPSFTPYLTPILGIYFISGIEQSKNHNYRIFSPAGSLICSTDTVAGYVLAVAKIQELIVYSRFGLFLETQYLNVAEILHMPSFKHYLTPILGISVISPVFT